MRHDCGNPDFYSIFINCPGKTGSLTGSGSSMPCACWAEDNNNSSVQGIDAQLHTAANPTWTVSFLCPTFDRLVVCTVSSLWIVSMCIIHFRSRCVRTHSRIKVYDLILAAIA